MKQRLKRATNVDALIEKQKLTKTENCEFSYDNLANSVIQY